MPREAPVRALGVPQSARAGGCITLRAAAHCGSYGATRPMPAPVRSAPGHGSIDVMAIIKSGTGTVLRTVIAGNLITISANGGQVMQPATTNRAKGSTSRAQAIHGLVNADGTVPQIPSAGFAALDQQIYALDGAYDQLPDKRPWEEYAANIEGHWQLCANCQPESTAKKLYRQYNMNRTLRGLPALGVPIDGTEFCDSEGAGWEYNPDPANGGPWINWTFPPGDTTIVTAQIGSAQRNPTLDLATQVPSMILPPNAAALAYITPILQFFGDPHHGTVSYPVCVQTPNGAPGESSVNQGQLDS